MDPTPIVLNDVECPSRTRQIVIGTVLHHVVQRRHVEAEPAVMGHSSMPLTPRDGRPRVDNVYAGEYVSNGRNNYRSIYIQRGTSYSISF